MANIQALANAEDLSGGENPWYLWPIYGKIKDEKSIKKGCTEGINLIFYHVEWEGVSIIFTKGGSENCETRICDEK